MPRRFKIVTLLGSYTPDLRYF
ncbi:MULTISPECIES: hypothetical protein [unclassified Bartonella]|nr:MULTISPECIES: hypothetical protein [unclassified Bartonella]